MAMQATMIHYRIIASFPSSSSSTSFSIPSSFLEFHQKVELDKKKKGIAVIRTVRASSASRAPPWRDWLKRQAPAPSLSDVIWPSAGAFAAMAILGRVDQLLAPKGVSMTIAPLGAVSAVLFATPTAPGARKYNMFVAQIGCAFIGVLAFYIFGPGWLARSAALAASIAFMIYTGSTHPPARDCDVHEGKLQVLRWAMADWIFQS